MNAANTPPFVAHLGIRHLDGGAEVTLAPHLLNRSGSAHGGLVATLLDTTMSRAALLACEGQGRVVTVEMSVSFVNPGKGTLRCQAWPIRRTGSLVFLESEVRDLSGLLVARGSASFKHRPMPFDTWKPKSQAGD